MNREYHKVLQQIGQQPTEAMATIGLSLATVALLAPRAPVTLGAYFSDDSM